MTDLATAAWSDHRDEIRVDRCYTGSIVPLEYLTGHTMKLIGINVVSPRPATPAWLNRYVEEVTSLIRSGVLEAGWNGHGARPLHTAAIELGMRVLKALLHEHSERPFPRISPTFRGGLELAWDISGIEMEIDIDPNGTVEVFFAGDDHTEWDGSLTEVQDDVREALDRLANRSSTATGG